MGQIYNILYSFFIVNGPNKLECLPLASLSSLVEWLGVSPEPTFQELHFRIGSWPLSKTLHHLPETNSLAYWVHSQATKKIKCSILQTKKNN